MDSLNNQIEKLKLFDKIKTENADMNNLNFKNNSFNAIWAEGSIYIIGFEKGIKQWKKLLKTKGYIAVSHISWLKDDPPNEITKFWKDNYPNIKNIQTNLNIIKNAGYNIINHFILSENAWFDDYYNPLQNNINAFITKYQNNNDALKIAKEEQLEINLYKKYSKYYGYVFYIMQKALNIKPSKPTNKLKNTVFDLGFRIITQYTYSFVNISKSNRYIPRLIG